MPEKGNRVYQRAKRRRAEEEAQGIVCRGNHLNLTTKHEEEIGRDQLPYLLKAALYLLNVSFCPRNAVEATAGRPSLG